MESYRENSIRWRENGQARPLCCRALKTTEAFDPSECTWREMQPMQTARVGPASVKYRDLIWVAGGMTKSKKELFSRDVECYDPIKNLLARFCRVPYDPSHYIDYMPDLSRTPVIDATAIISMRFQMAKSGIFEVTEVLRLLLRRIRLPLRDRGSIDHGERHSEHQQHRHLGWERIRLEGTSEHVDREARTFYRLDRSVFLLKKKYPETRTIFLTCSRQSHHLAREKYFLSTVEFSLYGETLYS